MSGSGAATASRPDLRATVLGVVAWSGGLGGFLLPRWALVIVLASAGAVLVMRWRRGRSVVAGAGWLLAAAGVALVAVLRIDAVAQSPVAELAEDEAFVSAVVEVSADPRPREGEYGPYALVRAETVEVTGRGRAVNSRAPVLVIGGEDWAQVELGARVRVEGRARPSDSPDLAAVLGTRRPPVLVEPPGDLLGAAEVVRGGIRAAVAGAGPGERTLVPALVVGDDRGMPAEVTADFQASGLTHLLAVSGTNLTLVVGFLLVLARWVGIRARGLLVVGLLGVVGFVLLARTEPSVVRAAAMGSVALLGMGSAGRERGVRALGVAVWVLLLVDPWLAVSMGFALSALATAGILFLAPPCRDAMAAWMPRWVAEAVAVPLTAQLACTPLVAAISGQVSLVAVVANMFVAPAVGPATVLGLVAGSVVLVVEPVGTLLGRLAAGCGWWIIVVADRSAGLPTAAVGWSTGAVPLLLLTASCLTLGLVLPRLLAGRLRSIAVSVVMLLVVVRPLPAPGWPPAGWFLVACDVGQGDGLVLNAGQGAAVVVDAGPDPQALDACLTRLEVRRVPVVVLTHFHADHVAGLPAVLAEHRPRRVLVTGLREPEAGAELVASWTREAGVDTRVPAVGEVRRTGSLTWQVVGPADRLSVEGQAGEGAANNASLALLVETRGVTALLTGDMEPEAQEAMAARFPDLRVDVLKVPHHGSRYQDPEFLRGLHARAAVVSVGADNGYGHPSAEVLELLEDSGTVVARTDRSGDVAVVVADDGQLTLRELSTSSSAIR